MGSIGPPPPPPDDEAPPVPAAEDPLFVFPAIDAADATTVVWADPDFVESCFETAVTVTAAGVGTIAGAV
jgi:hypothetical protein